LSNWYKTKFKTNSRVGVMFYTSTLYLGAFIIFTTIGCFYFTNGSYTESLAYYGTTVTKLYNFCDLVSNWSSLFIFIGLGVTILAALIKKHYYQKFHTTKWFTPMGIIGLCLIVISIIYEFIANFYDLGSTIRFALLSNNKNDNIVEWVIPAVLQSIILIVFTLVVALSGLNKKSLKK
jgi:hypothetical protein